MQSSHCYDEVVNTCLSTVAAPECHFILHFLLARCLLYIQCVTVIRCSQVPIIYMMRHRTKVIHRIISVVPSYLSSFFLFESKETWRVIPCINRFLNPAMQARPSSIFDLEVKKKSPLKQQVRSGLLFLSCISPMQVVVSLPQLWLTRAYSIFPGSS